MNMDCNNNMPNRRRLKKKSKRGTSSVHSLTSSSRERSKGQTTTPLISNQITDDTFLNGLPFLQVTFEFLEFLAEGSYGKVIKVRHKHDGKIYAIKCILLDDDTTIAEAEQEVECLSTFKHRNIVGYYTSWVDNMQNVPHSDESVEEFSDSVETFVCCGLVKNNNNISTQRWMCIKMEYCETTLAQVMKTDPFRKSNNKLDYFWQIVKGLCEVHKQGYIHRDLKPSNILIDDENCAKIADFGLAYKIVEGGPYNENNDMYDLSIILNEMFGGVLLFTGGDGCSCPEEFAEASFLFRWLLLKPHSTRPSCTELLEYYNNNAISYNKIRTSNEAFSQSI